MRCEVCDRPATIVEKTKDGREHWYCSACNFDIQEELNWVKLEQDIKNEGVELYGEPRTTEILEDTSTLSEL